MDLTNVAYTQEYQEYAKSFDYIFETKPKYIEDFILGNGEYFVEEYMYSENGVTKIIIKNKSKETILEVKAIYDNKFVNLIKHKNGKDYIIYRKDLYGYSIFDVADNKSIDYIPKESFKSGETFIWCELKYCAINDLLAVFGCYWACPYEFEFFDFTNPMEVPFPMYCKIEDNEDMLSGEMDFTENGKFKYNISDRKGNKEERIIDILNCNYT